MTSACLYYTDNRLDPVIAEACQRQLRRAAGDRPIVAVSLQPIDFGDVRIVLPLERAHLTMFLQIVAGLEALAADVVFFTEHDCLYPEAHFAFVPAHDDVFYYNEAVWKVCATTGRALYVDHCSQVSGLCGAHGLLLKHYQRRVERVRRDGGYDRRVGYEPGARRQRHGGVDDYPAAVWWSDRPIVDIRHAANLTRNRWRKDQFRNPRYTEGWTEAEEIPGWGRTGGRFDAWLQEVTR